MVTDWWMYVMVGINVRHPNIHPRSCLYRCWCTFKFVSNLCIFCFIFNSSLYTLGLFFYFDLLLFLNLVANMNGFTNENSHIIKYHSKCSRLTNYFSVLLVTLRQSVTFWFLLLINLCIVAKARGARKL